MLYPLSYEGLRCTFAQHGGRSWSIGLGLVASFQTVCAAPVPRAVDQLLTTAPHAALIVRRVMSSPELEAAQAMGVTTWLLLAMVMLVGSMGRPNWTAVVAVGKGPALVLQDSRCAPSVPKKCRTGRLPTTLSQISTYPPLTLRVRS
jgi:hypothetical protein